MKKVLIFYTSVGLGHKTIAENIGRDLLAFGYEVKLADAYKAQDGMLVSVGKKIHRFMNVSAPWLWRFFYTNKAFTNFGLKLRLRVAEKNSGQILEIIKNFNPDAVISTQTAPSAVLAYLKSKKIINCLFGIAFCDYHLHRFWLYKEADFYLANLPEQKNEMTKLGVSAEKIFLTGFGVKAKTEINAGELKKKFNIENDKKIILLSAGSLGIGLKESIIKEIIKNKNWHLLLLCGGNEEAAVKFRKIFTEKNVTILDYYKPAEELYALADVFLTKPGGMSISEALSFGLPMIIVSALPGQEDWNLKYLLKERLVMKRSPNLTKQIEQELSTGKFKQSLKNNPSLLDIFGQISPADVLQKLL